MKYVLQSVLGSAIILFVLLSAFAYTPAHAEEYYWSYSGEITNIGTRSEGFNGGLSYRGNPLSPKLGQIVTLIGEFKYENSGRYAWAARGWRKVQKLPKVAVINIPEVSESKDEPHWMVADKLRNPPRDWVFLPLYNYWVAPEYLQQFADAMLKTIPEPEKFSLDAVIESPSSAAVFVYKEAISGKGSKSAGWRGYLLYNGKQLQKFGTLKTPIGTFNAASSDRLWESQGWFPAEDIVTKDTAVPVDQAELKKGSYKGPKKAGTPSDWCYVPDIDTWFSPDQLL